MSGEIRNAGGGGQGAVRLGQADDGCIEVGAGKVDLLGALGGHGLAGNHRVKGAGLDTGNQGIPVGLDNLEFPAVGFADLLADHDVIAVGIGAGDIRDGNGAVGVVGLGPVVGGIGTFHGDGEDTVLHAAGNFGIGRKGLGGGQRKQHHDGQQHCNRSSHGFSFLSRVTLRLFLPAGGDNKMNRFVSGPWKIGNRTCIPVIIDSAPQSFVTVCTIFLHSPEPKEQASCRIFGDEPFPVRRLPGLAVRY